MIVYHEDKVELNVYHEYMSRELEDSTIFDALIVGLVKSATLIMSL